MGKKPKPVSLLILYAGTMIFCILCIISTSCQTTGITYEPTWESLKQHPVPEWFRDAKFGIYTHWGPRAVPAYGTGWYPNYMYTPGSPTYEYHKETFGDPLEFGFKDFIPMFNGEKFNADEWADLFKQAGAQFAGPLAEHHDGFAMWDSDLSKWDAADMGPQRDIVGELARAVKKRGMKFICSFHHAFKWKYYEPSFTPDKRYDTQDPKYAGIDGLYPPPHEKGAPESKEYLENWEAKMKEVVDKYQPDYLYYDFGWREPTFEEYKKSFIAYYYNKAEKWGKEVVLTYKDEHLPLGVGVLDLERHRMDTLAEWPWATDTSVDWRAWFYIKDPEYKSVNRLVDVLVDIVSKNGNLLLNIGPRPDGTIPNEQKELLLGIGEWLDVNGEAIYETRPWLIYGEGAAGAEQATIDEDDDEREYTAEDIRFTAKNGFLYAIALDWPAGGIVTIRSLGSESELYTEQIRSVSMLGSNSKLGWSRDEEGLKIKLPLDKPCEHAVAFKIR